MTKDPSDDDPRFIAYKAILIAIKTDPVFSYSLDWDVLRNLIGKYYDATFALVEGRTEIIEKAKTANTEACVSYMQQRLSEKLIIACGELVAESFTFAQTFALQSLGAPASLVNRTKISAKVFESLLVANRQRYIAPLKEHFLRDHHGSEAAYDLAELASHYPELLRIWRLAKADAIRDQEHSQHKDTWRERLGSYRLPDDLVEWLNQSKPAIAATLSARTDLPHLQKRLENGYALTKPSEIALEHSARLCGAEPYFYSVAHLFKFLKEKR